MKLILVGGTPGTGKTEVAKLLGAQLKRRVVALGDIAKSNDCTREHDSNRDTWIIDEDCLVDAIMDLLDDSKDDFIIEGHYIDLVPSRSVEQVFVLRTHPDDLKQRLTQRNYTADKVQENLESEIYGVCQLDALNSFGEAKVFEVDTTELTAESTVDEILSIIKSKESPTRYDWMADLEDEGRLNDFISDA
ncbi:MAG: adenylate kinase family protein [Candidatus Thorarchaeota archaeon]|nr:adenylate kinase family protein [Candidatus Thorarchaeota archaeon]